MSLQLEHNSWDLASNAKHANLILAMVMHSWRHECVNQQDGVDDLHFRHHPQQVAKADQALPQTWPEFVMWYRKQATRCAAFENTFSMRHQPFIQGCIEASWTRVRDLIQRAAASGQAIDCRVGF